MITDSPRVCRKHLTNAITILLLSVCPAVALAQQWRAHSYPDEGFRVEFNGPVIVRPIELDAETRERIVRGTQYMQDGGTYIRVAAASLNRFNLNFDSGAEKSFAGLQCKTMLSDSPFDAPWGKGRELQGTDCVDGSYRAEARYHQSGLWFYQVLTLFQKDSGDAASARYFLDSFKAIRPSK